MDGLVTHDDGIVIDGSIGEGGGQILRTALGLSVATGRPFRMVRIRKRRSRSGLLRQHATAVAAAAAVSNAHVVGGEVGSETLVFTPRAPRAGRYEFAIGTAGSTSLVLHAILPGLLAASGESEVVLSGGTDAQSAPPFDHLARVYVPLLRAMGVDAEATLDRRGFYPAGGGRFRFRVRGGALAPIDPLERGPLASAAIVSRLAGGLSRTIGDRELAAIGGPCSHLQPTLRIEHVESAGPGNTLSAILEFEHATTVFTSFGAKDRSSEQVASQLASEIDRFLDGDVPIDEHTADQLVLLLALAGSGTFRTTAPTEHTRTQAALIPAFLDVAVTMTPEERATKVEVAATR